MGSSGEATFVDLEVSFSSKSLFFIRNSVKRSSTKKTKSQSTRTIIDFVVLFRKNFYFDEKTRKKNRSTSIEKNCRKKNKVEKKLGNKLGKPLSNTVIRCNTLKNGKKRKK